MAKKNRPVPDSVMHCACVLHGTVYDWSYVEKLFNMIQRHLSGEIKMHVYTEPSRAVPDHMIRHDLQEWPGIVGAKKSWWYKMQLFDSTHHQGNLLYFDLDVVLYNDLDWIRGLHSDYFWTLRDFRYLQRSGTAMMNSSFMYWNVARFDWVWRRFQSDNPLSVIRRLAGDQDYLNQVIDISQRRFIEDWRSQSWRWQAWDGGMDFRRRTQRAPGTGTRLNPEGSILVFHGRPKPHEIQDPVIQELWR